MIDPSLHSHLLLVLTIVDYVDGDQLEEGLGISRDSLAEAVAVLRSAMGIEEAEELDEDEAPLPGEVDDVEGTDFGAWLPDGDY